MTPSQQSLSAVQLIAPGRLGDPGMVLKTDPRADPRMLAALAECGLDQAPPPAPVTSESPLEEILEFFAGAEIAFEEMFKTLFSGLPPIENVERRTEMIKGVDDNAITLHVHRPMSASGRLPCVYHIHGGGMVILQASGCLATRWRDELAAAGLVVVGVEFRNGAGKLGNHPFPAGLSDCMSGLQWTFDNKVLLGISKIVVSGESGGGNLSLAVALKAKSDHKLHQIDGVYAMCPCISNAWAHKIPELPSLYENDDYCISCSMAGANAVAYDPKHENDRNPLCWPYCAETPDLEGLPPHVISVNELDPLRDEGLAYYRRLMSAGVSAYSRTVNGTCHCGDMHFRKALPAVFGATVRDIKGFADSLMSI
jgi:acetyl esterase